MAEIVCLGTAKAAPGRKAWGRLNVAEGARKVSLGVAAINGAGAGPHVVVLANQHGSEINGIESIRRFVEQVDPRKLRGTVFAIASANPKAAMLMNECWPEGQDESLIQKRKGCPYIPEGGDRNSCAYNMNRKWPGRKGSGLLVERVVYEIWNRAVMAPHAKATLLMDLHCHQSPSSIYAACADDVPIGVASGVPNVIRTRSWGSGRQYSYVACRNAGIRSMTVELGGQGVLDETSIEIGRRAIFNMLRFYGLLRDKPEFDARTQLLDPWRGEKEKLPKGKETWKQYEARHDGLVRVLARPFDSVRKGRTVAEILDPFTGQIVERCAAPMSGALYALRLPTLACRKGQRIFDVAAVRRVKPAEYLRSQDLGALRQPPGPPPPG